LVLEKEGFGREEVPPKGVKFPNLVERTNGKCGQFFEDPERGETLLAEF